MEADRASATNLRQRILLVAHSFDVDYSMESRLSWFRAMNAARNYDVTVLCAEPFANVRCDVDPALPGVQVVAVPHSMLEKRFMNSTVGFYFAYRIWHRRVLKVARQLHARRTFSLVHQVSYCGYREPGYCWQLGVPFVWGPIGGTQNVPWRFLSQFDLLSAAKEACRSIANTIQLRMGRRVGQALRAASTVFVANQEVRASFNQTRGVELPYQLETGVERIADEPKPLRDPRQPLRILWAGRLEQWKALPLLLRAFANLPNDCRAELRVVGSGSQEHRWKQQAKRLGIDERIEWIPLPDCSAREQHYQWADVFAFTSLRDTSGTGLLESLAAGTPIVGLNHQGARDIMSEDCAMTIPVENPRQVIAALQAALVQLSTDRVMLRKLSAGALLRAQKYHWEALNTEMNEAYDQWIQVPNRVRPRRNTDRDPILQQTTSVVG